MAARENSRFATRAGEKLCAALAAFGVDVAGLVCADFGCNIGGFTDCLLQHGASRVVAVDTGYGDLAWKLRKDARVVVMERTNALHCEAPEPVDLAVIDVGWTPQSRIVPAAMQWLKPATAESGRPRVLSLLKPHYELAKSQGRRPAKVLDDLQAGQICLATCRDLAAAGYIVRAVMRSPLRGKGGNLEFVLAIS